MLATQVEYWKYQETKRHNLASESLQQDTNNIQREQVNVNWFTANENARHNKEQESIGWANANENIRHNQVSEQLGFQQLAETTRHNVAQEDIGYRNASANISNANANTLKARTDAQRYSLEASMRPYNVKKLKSETKKNVYTAYAQSAAEQKYLTEAEKSRAETSTMWFNSANNLLNSLNKFGL